MIVYKITNLLNGKVYVGQTVRTLEARIDQHKRRTKSAISQAIGKYGWENFKVEVLEECETQEELNEREKFWIKFFDCIAPKGYNLNEGGRGGKVSEIAKKHMSESQQVRFSNPAEHEKLSKAQKKYFSKLEARQKMSEAKKNPSPEARANMSAAQKRRFSNPEARAKKSAETKKYYEEHPEAREYLSNLNKGKKQSAETIAKKSASLKGHPTSAETRAKISAAHKARWAKLREKN